MAVFNVISAFALPVVILGIILYGVRTKTDCFASFTDGAKDGITTTIGILPTLVGLMTAIAVFRASGAMDFIVELISPVTALLGIPKEVMPLAFLRPISGSASLAMLGDIYKTNGPDSLAGITASVMMGSTETVFYTIAVYLAGAGVKKTSYIVPVSLIISFSSVIIACIICRML